MDLSGDGFGSNFNYRFMTGLVGQVAQGFRAVYVLHKKFARDFHYQCPEKLGMGCFFQLPCNDSMILFGDLPSTASLIDSFRARDVRKDHHLFIKQYELYMQTHENSTLPPICDTSAWGPTYFTSLATQFIWKLTPDVLTHERESKLVKALDNELKSKNDFRYAAGHIRLTDKNGEMGPDAWSWMQNRTNIVALLRQHLIAENISTLFIAADNCTVYHEVAPHLEDIASLHSECYLHDRDYVAGRRGILAAYEMITDINIFSRATLFFGNLYSNVARIVYRLQYPNVRTVNFADEFFKFDKNKMGDFKFCVHASKRNSC